MAHHPQLSDDEDSTLTAKSRSTWEIIRRVAVYLRPYKLMALGMFVCALLSLALAFAYPRLTRMTRR